MKINCKITKDEIDKIVNDKKIMVYDDFFDSLYWHETILKKGLYRIDKTSPYPGEFLIVKKDYLIQCLSKIKKAFEVPMEFDTRTGWFGLLHQGHKENLGVVAHIDVGFLVMLIYLTDPLSKEDAKSQGTHFYRHKKLKKEFINKNDHRDYIIQLKLYEFDSKNPEKWEIWKTIDMKKNRAIIFSGDLWHSTPKELRGNELSNGRLTQNFFVKLL